MKSGYLVLLTLSIAHLFSYMEIVHRRNAATLLPIIQFPGSIVVRRDEWAAYNRISSIPVVAAHQTVDHSLHFVDPATHVHTQNVESYWNRFKTKLKRMKGISCRLVYVEGKGSKNSRVSPKSHYESNCWTVPPSLILEFHYFLLLAFLQIYKEIPLRSYPSLILLKIIFSKIIWSANDNNRTN